MSGESTSYLRIPLGMHIVAVSPSGEEVSGIVNRVTERREFVTRVLIAQEDGPQRRIDLPPWQLKFVNGRAF
jgi:hypothetical protein